MCKKRYMHTGSISAKDLYNNIARVRVLNCYNFFVYIFFSYTWDCTKTLCKQKWMFMNIKSRYFSWNNVPISKCTIVGAPDRNSNLGIVLISVFLIRQIIYYLLILPQEAQTTARHSRFINWLHVHLNPLQRLQYRHGVPVQGLDTLDLSVGNWDTFLPTWAGVVSAHVCKRHQLGIFKMYINTPQ